MRMTGGEEKGKCWKKGIGAEAYFLNRDMNEKYRSKMKAVV